MRPERRTAPWVVLALALMLAALWVRSMRVGDVLAVFAGRDARLQALASSRGRLCVAFTNVRVITQPPWTALHAAGDGLDDFVMLDPGLLNVWPQPPAALAAGTIAEDGVWGFSVATSQGGVVTGADDSRVVYVTVPHWSAVAVCGVAAPWMLLGPRARRARRRAKGLCEQCGYDLRASPGRCPECGATTALAPT